MSSRSSPQCEKSWKICPDHVLVRVIAKLESLSHDARPPGCKKLKGYRDQWCIRVGDWRVLYMIDDAAKLISATRIGHRREVYE